MPIILGIESTCDETGAAVVVDGREVRSNVVASQVDLHQKYRGVVPEIASRAHIENILPVITDALGQAGCEWKDIDAVSVAHRPGLIGSLLIGVTAAKSLAWALGRLLIGVDHVHAHLYSVVLEGSGFGGQGSAIGGRGSGVVGRGLGVVDRNDPLFPIRNPTPETRNLNPEPGNPSPENRNLNPEPRTPNPSFPAVGLVCSGGHTALYRLESWRKIELIGSTIDDAVGEAYDKVAAILGLGYPGGPIIDGLAKKGNPEAIQFPRSLLGKDSLDFSFSGLKTSVLYHVRGVPQRGKPAPPARPIAEGELHDICASFQAACVDTILKKIRRAMGTFDAKSVIIGGGVSANSGLREAMRNFDLPVHFPPMQYCTDNAAMSAGLAHVFYESGEFSPLEMDAITYSQFH